MINEGGVNGSGQGMVNPNAEDYKALQAAVLEHAQQQTEAEKCSLALLSLKFQMESYISTKQPSPVVEAGNFLKQHIKALNIKNKTFANYIELEESNLSAILNGKRRISIDLALKLGQLFDISPTIWLLIQSKNDLLKVEAKKKIYYKKYKLEDLLKHF